MSGTVVQYFDEESKKPITVTQETPLPVSVALGKGSVGADELKDESVTTPKIVDGAVTTPKIADGAVTVEKLAEGLVVPLAEKAGEADQIADGSVTLEKLAQAVLDLINSHVKKSGDTLTGPLVFADPNNRSKIILTKYPDGIGHNDAPTTLDLNSVYLHLGGTEYAANSFRLIGFGYRHHKDSSHPSVVAGSQEIDTYGNNMGDFIVGTRNSFSDVAPVIVFRVTHDGQIVAEQADYVPASDRALTNRKYVDGVVPGLLAGVNPIADPSKATVEDVANAYNALLAALKG